VSNMDGERDLSTPECSIYRVNIAAIV
jgi:hypothetical protein